MSMRMVLLFLVTFLSSSVLPAADAFLSVGVHGSSWRPTCQTLLFANSQGDVPKDRLATKPHQQRSGTTTSKGRQLRRTWEESFQLLLEFREEQGHYNVPKTYKKDPRLGKWVNNQRHYHKKGTLKEDNREKLESVGFSWSAREDAWHDNYQKLVKYKEEHGDCNVPQKRHNYEALAQWVKVQRVVDLSIERRAKLDEIGFSWNLTRPWDELYQELVAYKEEHGDCNIPRTCSLNPTLAAWVCEQRSRKAVLSVEQRGKLDSIEFTWEDSRKEIFDKRWHEMLDKLRKYWLKHGHCRVPVRWSKDPSLGLWVQTQRKRYSQRLLPRDYEEELNKMDFTWRLKSFSTCSSELQKERWLEKYAALEDFLEEHGHVNIPSGYNATLFNWVRTQRTLYRQERLQEDRKNLLEHIGFEWTVRGKQQDEQWLQNFAEYRTLVDSKDPSLITESLQHWIKRQRIAHAGGKLKPERKALLDDIGVSLGRGEPTFPS